MDSAKYVGMNVPKEAATIAVMNSAGKLVMESIVETKAAMVVQFLEGLRGELYVTFEEGTWAVLYGLLKAARDSHPNHNHDLKSVFKGAATKASSAAGPFRDFYSALLAQGMKPTMARLTLARKIAAITLIVWKKGVCFDAEHLKRQVSV